MKFQIGDMVKHKDCDVRFVIDHIRKYDDGSIQYAGKGWCGWFNEDGLCLVEPFKVGDLVEVIGNPSGVGPKAIGQRLRIDLMNLNSDGQSGYFVDGWWYPASSLRKVQPEVSEIGKIRGEIGHMQDQIDELKRDALAGERLARAFSKVNCGRIA